MLTDNDRAWLKAIRDSHRSWTPLILAEIRGMADEDLQRLAGDILVFYNHMFVSARQLADAAINEARVFNSQIDQAYDYGCALAVHQVADKLSTSDARALLLASGYHSRDLDELAAQAAEAVKEARQELYAD